MVLHLLLHIDDIHSYNAISTSQLELDVYHSLHIERNLRGKRSFQSSTIVHPLRLVDVGGWVLPVNPSASSSASIEPYPMNLDRMEEPG